MLTKKFNNLNLSTLGFGAMRLLVINGDDSKIDEAATAELVSYAIQHGINYFDTEWGSQGRTA